MKKRGFEESVIKQIVDMYVNEKKSPYEIAEEFNTYAGKIRNVLIDEKIKLRGRSEAAKAALKSGRSTHPTEGKERPDSVKKKISHTRSKAWKEMSDEDFENFRQGAAQRWKDMPFEKKIEMQRLAGSALRKSSIEGSKAEKFLYEKLLEEGYNVEMHKKDLVYGDYEVDLFIAELKTVIEIDGPQHFMPVFGEDSLKKTVKYDSIKNGSILSDGFTIIRVKYMCSKISERVKDDLWKIVDEKLTQIKKKYPKEGDRLIEVEVK